MLIVGDVHGKYHEFFAKIRNSKDTFQVGDMGLGFDDLLNYTEDNESHLFIRGNHDDPALCKKHPNYAGEFGYIKEKKLFFCGGAISIDKMFRIAYEKKHGRKIWWPDEELSESQLENAKQLYIDKKPEIVITHDCPASVRVKLLTKIAIGFRPEKEIPSRTCTYFESMFLAHQPKIWVFGHYHIDQDFKLAGTRFICLNELSTIEI